MFIRYSCCLERQKLPILHLSGLPAQDRSTERWSPQRHRDLTFLKWSPVSASLSSPRAMSVLHCLRKESLGVLQLQSLAQVREAKDTAWNVPWIKQRMGPQRVNITPTHGPGIHTAAPGTEFFLLPPKTVQYRACRVPLLLSLLSLCGSTGVLPRQYYFPEYEGKNTWGQCMLMLQLRF